MIQTLYDSGLRVSELLSLRLIDLDFSQSALRVIGKGDKQRLAMMSPPQAVALKAYLERGRSVLMGNRPEHGIVFVNAPSFLWFGREQRPKSGGAPLTRYAADAVLDCPKAGPRCFGSQHSSSPVAPLFRFHPD